MKRRVLDWKLVQLVTKLAQLDFAFKESDMDILCNVRSCRKPLTSSLWVTRCSHCFCEEHASVLTQKNTKCPACSRVLGKRYDVIRQNSNPTPEFRAMFLVGLRPEIVMKIAMHAVTFWNYQLEMELKYQSSSAKHIKEASEKMKDNYAVILKQLAAAKKTRETYEKQIGDFKNSIKVLKDQITSKDRQLQQMQFMLNSLKNKMECMQTNMQDNVSDSHSFLAGQTGDSLQLNIHGGMGDGHNFQTVNGSDFVFKPYFDLKRKCS